MAGPIGPDTSSLSDSTTTSDSFSSVPSSHFPSSSSHSELNDIDSSYFPPYHAGLKSYSPTFGHPISKDNPSGTTSKPLSLGFAASATGQKLKRVINARRKKHRDDPSPPASNSSPVDGPDAPPSAIPPASPMPKKGLGFHLPSQVFGGHKKSAKSHELIQVPTAPPPLPPKLSSPPTRKQSLPPDAKPPHLGITPPPVPARNTVIPLSPGIASAVQYMNQPPAEDDPETMDKESWRKSDSTMSHHTIRPSTTIGSRTPRPGSIAATVEEDDIPNTHPTDPMTPTWQNQDQQQQTGLYSHTSEVNQSSSSISQDMPPFNGGDNTPPSPQLTPPPGTNDDGYHDTAQHKTSLSVSSHGSARSMSFAPAVGLAKRAVERMGRAWGGITPPSSFPPPGQMQSSSQGDLSLNRVESNQSSAERKKMRRRTPNAASGTWSIGPSTNNSPDSDVPSLPLAPYLGRLIRAPINPKGGVVFGRNLKSVVRHAPIQPSVALAIGHSRSDYLKSLETRSMPAIAVRCAQHIAIWGIQEEGLFRVNGRPFHVNKVRSEFDTGADYNMMECSPSELDPHAVAGVFKAFLRELPEPILTHALAPYFEAIIVQESELTTPSGQSHAKIGGRGPSLPSGPRVGLRKPPSLSTLAMPDLHTMRKPSVKLIQALRSLVARLPRENSDLLRTVVELIKTTAKESKVTKMPLSNLLVVFCPSLHMNPPLLRVLAECDEVWEEDDTSAPPAAHTGPSSVVGEDEVLDIRRATMVLDEPDVVLPSSTPEKEEAPLVTLDETPSVTSAESSVNPPSSPPSPSLIDVHNPKSALRARPVGPRTQSPTSQSTFALFQNIDFTKPPPEIQNVDQEVPVDVDSSSDDNPSEEGSESDSHATSALSSVDFSPDSKGLTVHTSPSAPALSTMKAGKSSNGSQSPAFMSHSVPFPTTSPSHPLAPRRSFPTLSLGGSSGSGDSSAKSPIGRRKLPSMNFLLPKRSASPASSDGGGRPFISRPFSPSTHSDPIHLRSISHPIPLDISPITVSPAVPVLPPVLDSAIPSASLDFSLSFDMESSENTTTPSSKSSYSPSDALTETRPVSHSTSPNDDDLEKPVEEPSLPLAQAQRRSVPGRSGINHSVLPHDALSDDDDWTLTIVLAANAQISSQS